MYSINGITLEVVRTWVYQADHNNDPKDGMTCVELRSADGRYSLITDAETLAEYME